jgi:hypothetical protein
MGSEELLMVNSFDQQIPPDAAKIRLRPHMVDFAHSMALACYIAEAADVLAYLRCHYPDKRPEARDIAQRYFGVDQRNGWRSWLISLRAAPLLWTDKPVPGIAELRPLHEVSGITLPPG